MRDFPLYILIAIVWAYWIGVAVMVRRVRTRNRKLAGLAPQQPLERLLWLIWVPLVTAWMWLPYLATFKSHPLLAVPQFALHGPFAALRWAAAGVALLCFLLTTRCWARMGNDWSTVVRLDKKTPLITDGLFARVRHPIYALSMLLMLCSAIIVATLPMIAIALVHVALMVVKARNEERFLLQAHGEAYERYCRKTGRFFPRLASGEP